ncbi:MAG TPA: glycosyltransferase [Kineosporiaceae bacterium]|nr:glycosyltransferase [Kineosporiaceae bacterium]
MYNWHDYLYWVPLGVLGIVRWVFWLVRRIPATLYRPVRNDHRASMSIVVPVYQEDPQIFALAITSWLQNAVDEVICVIDASDTVCQEVAARYPIKVIITDVPGKRDALRVGWEAARSELVALVDSDVIWADNAAVELMMPFADPVVGGVASRQNVYDPRGFLSRVNDMYLDYRYFDENAAQTYLGRAVSCISGRTAVYRRHILLEISADFMNERFLGVPCLSGDDKCLTRLTLSRGYTTVMQRTARVWSTFPSDPRTFVKQRMRWGRNTWRSDIAALFLERWAWRRPYLALTMVDKMVASFTVLVAPVYMALAIVHANWRFVGMLFLWWWVSRSAKLLPHLRRRPSSFFYIPAFVLLTFVMAGVKIYALATIRRQRWLTRQVAVVDGEVVRTIVEVGLADGEVEIPDGVGSGADPDATAEIEIPAEVEAAGA